MRIRFFNFYFSLPTFLAGFFFLLIFYPLEVGAEDTPKYIGVSACTKLCHNTPEEGNQHEKWLDSKHSYAYQTLSTKAAKENIKRLGLKGDPQKLAKCLLCHTTGYGEPAEKFSRKFTPKDGVACEACHGPGSLYKNKKTMEKISLERGPEKDQISPTAEITGLTLPNRETCLKCHVEKKTWRGETFTNPEYVRLNFDLYYLKIKHPKPIIE